MPIQRSYVLTDIRAYLGNNLTPKIRYADMASGHLNALVEARKIRGFNIEIYGEGTVPPSSLVELAKFNDMGKPLSKAVITVGELTESELDRILQRYDFAPLDKLMQPDGAGVVIER